MAAAPVAPHALVNRSPGSRPPKSGGRAPASGRTSWRARRLRRNKAALVFGALFLVDLPGLPAGAGLRARRRPHRAERQPRHRHVKVGGKDVNVVSTEGIPIGPTWHGRFFLGADQNGRDVAVRLLYGGRNSLEIGLVAALITMFLATIIGHRSRATSAASPTASISRCPGPDVGVPGRAARRSRSGTALALGGLHVGPLNAPGQLAADAGADHRLRLRPVRGQADPRPGARPARAGVRRRRARCRGSATLRIMFSEILPNLASTIIVFIPLIIANAILLEAGAVVPRRRRAAAEAVVGHDDQRRHPADPERDPPDDRAGPDARADGARRSTSSATACATRSTRAPRCGWSTGWAASSSGGCSR